MSGREGCLDSTCPPAAEPAPGPPAVWVTGSPPRQAGCGPTGTCAELEFITKAQPQQHTHREQLWEALNIGMKVALMV